MSSYSFCSRVPLLETGPRCKSRGPASKGLGFHRKELFRETSGYDQKTDAGAEMCTAVRQEHLADADLPQTGGSGHLAVGRPQRPAQAGRRGRPPRPEPVGTRHLFPTGGHHRQQLGSGIGRGRRQGAGRRNGLLPGQCAAGPRPEHQAQPAVRPQL